MICPFCKKLKIKEKDTEDEKNTNARKQIDPDERNSTSYNENKK